MAPSTHGRAFSASVRNRSERSCSSTSSNRSVNRELRTSGLARPWNRGTGREGTTYSAPRTAATDPPGGLMSAGFGVVDLGRAGKAAGAYIVRVFLDRAADFALQVGVPAHEFRRPVEQPQHVVDHQNLAVAAGGGADPDGGHGD